MESNLSALWVLLTPSLFHTVPITFCHSITDTSLVKFKAATLNLYLLWDLLLLFQTQRRTCRPNSLSTFSSWHSWPNERYCSSSTHCLVHVFRSESQKYRILSTPLKDLPFCTAAAQQLLSNLPYHFSCNFLPQFFFIVHLFCFLLPGPSSALLPGHSNVVLLMLERLPTDSGD